MLYTCIHCAAACQIDRGRRGRARAPHEELEVDTITSAELKDRLDAGEALTLVDTRLPAAHAAGHLPNALLGTSDFILERAPTLLPDRAACIVTYSGDLACRRSTRAAERLESLGYSNVLEYAAGYEDWVAQGHPVEVAAAADPAAANGV
jgi:rhodanese-related sulfurtransferase